MKKHYFCISFSNTPKRENWADMGVLQFVMQIYNYYSK